MLLTVSIWPLECTGHVSDGHFHYTICCEVEDLLGVLDDVIVFMSSSQAHLELVNEEWLSYSGGFCRFSGAKYTLTRVEFVPECFGTVTKSKEINLLSLAWLLNGQARSNYPPSVRSGQKHSAPWIMTSHRGVV
jgi:hypothetical protein